MQDTTFNQCQMHLGSFHSATHMHISAVIENAVTVTWGVQRQSSPFTVETGKRAGPRPPPCRPGAHSEGSRSSSRTICGRHLRAHGPFGPSPRLTQASSGRDGGQLPWYRSPRRRAASGSQTREWWCRRRSAAISVSRLVMLRGCRGAYGLLADRVELSGRTLTPTDRGVAPSASPRLQRVLCRSALVQNGGKDDCNDGAHRAQHG